MASVAKTIVLITGANSGIGFELAAQLLAKGTYHVLLGSRSTSKSSSALADLQSRSLPGTAEMLQLDMTDDDTISRAASTVEENHGKLDILVNNAAVALPPGNDREQLRTAFDTNATGPYILTKVLLPLLQKSTSARVINISSGVGSMGRKLDPSSPLHKHSGVQYRASKAALNMVFACQFVEYGDLGIKVSLYDPGFTVSNLGPHNNVESGARSARESVLPLVDVLEGKRDDEAGLFLHNTGTWPW
ncbi:putative short chain dehydrogenase/reductase [Lentithecium fluviatile CBS 122367]|uniref:Putative short chain dehydrogenase/reductase n=1 Tax=Lentithecium fluviatile CBS 122367 TaxID=1168545 RepID=A0A6G1J4Z2_9PLEO|nr:putative short chain dehydrogenase/reductase [Lentithecium fluviatile CBS 122367]